MKWRVEKSGGADEGRQPLNKIRVFCEENPDLIIIGAGDVKQLPSIEPYTNCQNVEEYVDSCIDIIFKHNIFLKI